MKKHYRLSLCIVLSLAMIISMIPMGTAFAAENEEAVADDILVIAAQPETSDAKAACTVSVYGEEKDCATLKEAIAAAGSWGEIRLNDDVETSTIEVTGNNHVSIELAGHKIKGTSKDGVVFNVSGETELVIQGWEGGGEIEGSVVITGGRPSINLWGVNISNDLCSPVYIKKEVLSGSYFHVSDGMISTKSDKQPAVRVEGNAECSILDVEVTSEGTGIVAHAGKVYMSGTNVTAVKTAVELGRTAAGCPVSVDLGGGTIKGETAILEKNGKGYKGSDKISVITNYSTIDGKIKSDNLGAFIQDSFFTEMPDEAYIDPACEVEAQETEPVTYAVFKRGEDASLKSLLVRDYYDDGAFFEDYYYYKTFEGVDFAGRLEQIKSDAQIFEYAQVDVVADNDAAVTASVNEKIRLIVNTFAKNKITAADGCKLNEETAGTTTIYTAEALPVSDSKVIVGYTEEKMGNSDFLELTFDGPLTGVNAVENAKIKASLAAIKDDIVAELGLNQSNISKALSEAGISYKKASDIKLYIVARIETEITTKESSSDKITAFGITARPVYEVFASTAKDASAIVDANNATAKKQINSVLLNEPTEFALVNKDGSNKDVKLRMPIPKEINLKSKDKIMLKSYPEGSYSPSYFIFENCRINGWGNRAYLTFSSANGLGEMKFSINGKVCYMSVDNGTPRYYEYLTNVLAGASNGETVLLTEDIKNLSDDEKTTYLTAFLYQAAEDVKIDRSAAPDVEFKIMPYTGYAYYKSTEGNVDTYNVVNVADLKFKAASKLTDKGIKVTVTPKAESREAFDQLKAQGYQFEYKFYRSEKKASKYAAKFTSKKNSFTNVSGKNGKKYYYKAKVTVTDPEGNVCATTELKNCSYAARTWR